MADSPAVPQGPGLFAGKGRATLLSGIWIQNPVAVLSIGMCSTLAVTNRLASALVMGLAVILITACSSFIISLLRASIPHRIRLIVIMAVVATFVITFDQSLKAFAYPMSKQLGPYVGLIIANCIVMGRAEGFALGNPPLLAALDGAANGLGYTFVLALVAVFRELLGSGQLLGMTVLPPSVYTPCQIMVLAPGAFLGLGLLVAFISWRQSAKAVSPEKKP
jgi:Na+-transporting NADH:ubiquinone oxidoreductase subunit D